MNRLDTITSGSDYNFSDKMQRPSFPSSAFDLSHNVTMAFPIGSVGALIPLVVLETVPSDRFDISVSHLLRVIPQTVPLYSQMKLYIHAFYSRSSDLWKNAQIYYRKGNNGNRVLTKPVLTTANCTYLDSDQPIGSNELLHFLYGLPIGVSSRLFAGKINALPFFMYFRIWRDYFCNKYYFENDTSLLPDDDADFRINNDGQVVSFGNADWQRAYTTYPLNDLGFLYRDFADDRFTAAMPSPQRGDAPTIEPKGYLQGIALSANELSPQFEVANVGDFLLRYSNTSADNAQITQGFTRENSVDFDMSRGVFNHTRSNQITNLHNWNSNQGPTVPYATFKFKQSFNIVLNDIRHLAINQLELEKMARTDGSYREFGLTFFGVASKSSMDFRPQYIGGTWQPVVFTEVVQTSGTAVGAGVLGQYAGHGISSNNGHIGSVYCDDYGYIMILASIVPETMYSQGLDKQHTRLYQADELIPERAKLGAQPVLNKELRFVGSELNDDGLFAYQDIFDEFRYVTSKVRGELANPSSNSYFPYTQSRYFLQTPTFSQSFATTKGNVRMDFLSSQADPPFTAQFRFNIRAVRPLPYRAVPAQIV